MLSEGVKCVELVVGMRGSRDVSVSHCVEIRKRARTRAVAGTRGCAAEHYEGSGGVSGGMLIGLWGAEPQQINSSERIMAWADIRTPLPPHLLPLLLLCTPTHILILLLTRREEVVKERGKERGKGGERRTVCDYDCECV